MIQYFLLHLYVIFYFICADCWFYNRNKTLHFEDRTGSCRQAKNKVMTYSAAPNKQSSSPAMWYAIIRILQNFITNLQVMGRHRGFHFCQGQRILSSILFRLSLWPNQPHILWIFHTVGIKGSVAGCRVVRQWCWSFTSI